MSGKRKKSVKQPKKASKAVKQPTAGPKLLEAFVRDLSFESLLPPSLYPRENRDMDFNLSATVRPLNGNFSCVNIAIRVRLSEQGKAPFIMFETIHEGVFDAPCANKSDAEILYVQGGEQLYERAKNISTSFLNSHGLQPPFPEDIDFQNMWQQGDKK